MTYLIRASCAAGSFGMLVFLHLLLLLLLLLVETVSRWADSTGFKGFISFKGDLTVSLLSCDFLSHHVTSGHVTPGHVTSSHVTYGHVTGLRSRDLRPCDFRSCDFQWKKTGNQVVPSCDFWSCDSRSCDLRSCDFQWKKKQGTKLQSVGVHLWLLFSIHMHYCWLMFCATASSTSLIGFRIS